MQLHFIANTPQPGSSGDTIPVIDPSDGQVFDHLQRLSVRYRRLRGETAELVVEAAEHIFVRR